MAVALTNSYALVCLQGKMKFFILFGLISTHFCINGAFGKKYKIVPVLYQSSNVAESEDEDIQERSYKNIYKGYYDDTSFENAIVKVKTQNNPVAKPNPILQNIEDNYGLFTSKDQKKEMVCKYIDGFQILNNGEIVKVSHPECYPINIKKMRKDEAKKNEFLAVTIKNNFTDMKSEISAIITKYEKNLSELLLTFVINKGPKVLRKSVGVVPQMIERRMNVQKEEMPSQVEDQIEDELNK